MLFGFVSIGVHSWFGILLAPGGKGKVFCPDCGKPILLRDVIEEKFDSPAVKEQVREMQTGGD